MIKELKEKERRLRQNIAEARTFHELENALTEMLDFIDYVKAIGLVFSEVYMQTDYDGRSANFTRPVLTSEFEEIAKILKGEGIDSFSTAYYNTEKFKACELFKEKGEGVFYVDKKIR